MTSSPNLTDLARFKTKRAFGSYCWLIIENSSAYLQGWLRELKNDKKKRLSNQYPIKIFYL
jgi:hypothetical protein